MVIPAPKVLEYLKFERDGVPSGVRFPLEVKQDGAFLFSLRDADELLMLLRESLVCGRGTYRRIKFLEMLGPLPKKLQSKVKGGDLPISAKTWLHETVSDIYRVYSHDTKVCTGYYDGRTLPENSQVLISET